jgi:hypothetical protein
VTLCVPGIPFRGRVCAAVTTALKSARLAVTIWQSAPVPAGVA